MKYSLQHHLFGWAAVASSNRGVCAVILGNSPHTCSQEMHELYPDAIAGADDALDARVYKVLAGETDAAELPLDPRGTEFQRSVWQFLRGIPRGTVLSYGDVARGIGRPTASRAVASAIGANRLGVLVPCHRVVRGDGGIGGFYWGVEMKRRLLELEGVRM